MAATHIDAVESFEIKNGIVRIWAVSDGDAIIWKMQLPVFFQGLAKAKLAARKHEIGGEVVPLKRRRT